jgi:hypothetical protein
MQLASRTLSFTRDGEPSQIVGRLTGLIHDGLRQTIFNLPRVVAGIDKRVSCQIELCPQVGSSSGAEGFGVLVPPGPRLPSP